MLLALAVAGVLASAAAATPTPTHNYVAFVAIHGHGSVRSTPKGIHCPGVCRALFPRGTHLNLRAAPARGWKLARFSGAGSCSGRHCGVDLVSTHDCIGGACPVGAFGVTARFVRRSGGAR